MAKVMATAAGNSGIRIDFLDDDTLSIFCDDELIVNAPMKQSMYRERARRINPSNFHPSDRTVNQVIEAYLDIPEVEEIA